MSTPGIHFLIFGLSTAAVIGAGIATLWFTHFRTKQTHDHEQTLLMRLARYQRIVETVADSIIVMTDQGIIQSTNPATAAMFGYSTQALLGLPIHQLIPDMAFSNPSHDQQLLSQTHKHHITTGFRQDASPFPVEIAFASANSKGDTDCFMTLRDITARVEQESALRKAKIDAEKASNFKSLFLANMSHEIRTPMNAILGYAQLLTHDEALSKKGKQATKAILGAGDHLLAVINNILDLSKIELGKLEKHPIDFDLQQVIQSMSTLFQGRCEQKHILWSVDADLPDSVPVHEDPEKLREILINLLGNAVKFTHQGEVKFRITALPAQHFQFEVIDTGPGIPEDHQATIFEPFLQSDQGLRQGGTGLGLAITQQLVDMLGGHIRLTSTPPQGTCFSVTLALPAALKPVTHLADLDERIPSAATASNLSALIVDDLYDNRQILHRILSKVGIRAEEACNGQEALDKIAQQQPTLVFMDIRMPVMDGLEAFQEIHKRWPETAIKCIAITASSLTHEREAYLAAGFDDYIAKPFRFKQIFSSIEALLDMTLTRQPNQATLTPMLQYDRITLPEHLYQQLHEATEMNAFSQLEMLIKHMSTLKNGTQGNFPRLADRFEDLLGQYDTEGIAKILNVVAHK